MMRRDIDDALHGWHYNPEPGEVIVRKIVARDGREILQIRIELGLIQMEVAGRPDGVRPHDHETYLSYLESRARSGGKRGGWSMTAEHCAEVDREFAQFYHRRIAWLTLQAYDRALLDADHTLALMDFIRKHAKDQEYIAVHERFRGLVLFHRTQAETALALENRRADLAIDAVREGIARISAFHETWTAEVERDETPSESLIEQLKVLEVEIRKNFSVEKTLSEQLDEAVADEDYERAALLRDQIRARTRR
ncbi:UvrB/UvrC motif-containing protein [Tundrisphaera sp. TA3]|uniref:UvrB/UvrC motif-containing protein n=1 Tax=Tundrisphaera sp. TA3 TaxID=3435775 RepID=UPI003EC02327